MSRKIVLVYSRSELARDERVQKQIKLCSRDYDVVSAGLGPYHGPVVRHIDLGLLIPTTPAPLAEKLATNAEPAQGSAPESAPEPVSPPMPRVPEMNLVQKLTLVVEHAGLSMLVLLVLRKLLPGFKTLDAAVAARWLPKRTVIDRAKEAKQVRARRIRRRMTEEAWLLLSRYAAQPGSPYPVYVWKADSDCPLVMSAPEDRVLFDELKENFDFFEALEVEKKHQQVIETLKDIDFALVFANDLSSINVVVPLAKVKGAKVIYDAHEFSPGQRVLSPETAWPLYFAAYKLGKYLPHCDHVMTACDSSSLEHVKWFGINHPITITNAPENVDLNPSPLDGDRVRMVHHGIASRTRALELMIDTVLLLDQRFNLDFYLITPDLLYFEGLQARCHGSNRIRFHPPVPSAQICESVNSYDLGIYILPPVNFNQKYALPNKFFEYIQARLGVAIGPSPEMMSFVEKYDLGVVAREFTPESMAEALAIITPQSLWRYKSNSHRYAAELSAVPQMERLKQLVAGVMSGAEVAT